MLAFGTSRFALTWSNAGFLPSARPAPKGRASLQSSSRPVAGFRDSPSINRTFSTEPPKVSFDLIKQLRDKTKAGMQDCGEALLASNLDVNKAAEWLQSKAKGVVAKKASRIASEGVVAAVVSPAGTKLALAELLSETDFAARSGSFINAAADFSHKALQASTSSVNWEQWADSPAIKAEVEKLIFGLRENVKLRRVQIFESDVLGYYAHQAAETQPATFPDASYTKVVGKFAAVGLKIKGGDKAKVATALQPFAKELAVHVLALKPNSIERNEKSTNKIEKKDDDDDIQSDVLLEQELFGEDITVGKALADKQAAIKKEFGGEFAIDAFVRWEAGEGVAKKEDNFADEVAKLVSGEKH